jgi:hypothetical protein
MYNQLLDMAAEQREILSAIKDIKEIIPIIQQLKTALKLECFVPETNGVISIGNKIKHYMTNIPFHRVRNIF